MFPCCTSPVPASGWDNGGWAGFCSSPVGFGVADHGLDFYGLPDAVKQAWQVIKGG